VTHISSLHLRSLPSFPTRRSSDLVIRLRLVIDADEELARVVHNIREPRLLLRSIDRNHSFDARAVGQLQDRQLLDDGDLHVDDRSEEHTSELQSLAYLVCRLLLEK